MRGQSGSTAPSMGRRHLQALWGASAGPEALATIQTVAMSLAPCVYHAASEQGGWQMIAPIELEKLEEYRSLLEDIIELQKQPTTTERSG